MKKYPLLTNIIRGAASRSGLNIKELSKKTGIPYQTIMQIRFRDPGSWRLFEIKALFSVIRFLPSEIEEIGKELGVV